MFHRHRGMICVRDRIPPGTDSTAKIHKDAPVPRAGRYDPNTLTLPQVLHELQDDRTRLVSRRPLDPGFRFLRARRIGLG